MSAELWMGIAIGSLGSWAFLIVVLSSMQTGKRNAKNGNAIANELLRERNEIGERQVAAMEEIHCLVQKVAFWEADRLRRVRLNSKAEQRERIAVSAFGHIPALIDAMDENPSYENIARHSCEVADALIKELEIDRS